MKWVLLALFVSTTACQHPINSLDQTTVLRSLYDRHEQWQGTPYQLGGMSQAGIDCSGFVALTFLQEYGITLPRTTQQQAQLNNTVARENMQAGDLLLFKIPQQKKYGHIGIFLENDRFLHASTSNGVMISSLKDNYWNDSFWKVVRVLKSH